MHSKTRWVLALWLAIGCAWGLGATPAAAKVSVIATYSDLAWVAQQVGGNLVTVESLCRGNQDPHKIVPRPSQVARMARAKLLVRIGMDLDLWTDGLIVAARNSRIARGGAGYVDCSQNIRKLDVPTVKLDPSKGDIHVYGNPHYTLDPVNLMRAAASIRAGLERVDPKHAATYQANEKALDAKLRARLAGWEKEMAPFRGRGIVLYHEQWIYFLTRFGLKRFAEVEPKPGLEPTAGHVAFVAGQMKAKGVKVILTASYKPRKFSQLLARQAGGAVVSVPGAVGGEKGVDDYFTLMDTIIARLSAALKQG